MATLSTKVQNTLVYTHFSLNLLMEIDLTLNIAQFKFKSNQSRSILMPLSLNLKVWINVIVMNGNFKYKGTKHLGLYTF